MFAAQLPDFVAWKTERGFHVILAVTGTPEVGTTTASIQAYLHGLYNNATPELPAPSFVLFVGDVAQMPTFMLSGDATDRPYCAVDADLVPDMYYGRFRATNPSQLQAHARQDHDVRPVHHARPELPGRGDADRRRGRRLRRRPTATARSTTGRRTTSTPPTASSATPTSTRPRSGPVEARDHPDGQRRRGLRSTTPPTAAQTSWSDPTFTQANINSLTNSGKYCLAVGNCCLTSTYDYGECFGETLLRAAGQGRHRLHRRLQLDLLGRGLLVGRRLPSSSQIDGTAWPYESTGIGAYDGVFHDHGEAEHLWYVTNDALRLLRQPGRAWSPAPAAPSTTGTSTTCWATRSLSTYMASGGQPGQPSGDRLRRHARP